MVQRQKDSHKGKNGKVAVIGGSKDYTGAPALSAQAALRTGPDLVKIVTSETISDVVASFSENLVVLDYPSGYLGLSGVEEVMEAVAWSDVMVIGPGLGEAGGEAVKEVLERTGVPKVIDADAIEPALDSDISNAVFTPHSGEADLIREKFGTIEEFVEEKEDVVVLEKGSTDRIYSEDGVIEIEAGHPGMTVGGTGDVLTGIVAGLISQGTGLEDAAIKAAEVNGRAGERAAEEYGNGLVATDLFDEISKVFLKMH
ncbi:MAG: NAD(P)H-hydrate dehydratase [Candidatus Nanohalobium sp.]